MNTLKGVFLGITLGGTLLVNTANAITKEEALAPALAWTGVICATHPEYQSKSGKCDVKIGVYDRTHGKYIAHLQPYTIYEAWKDGKDEKGQWYFGNAKAPDGTDLTFGIAINEKADEKLEETNFDSFYEFNIPILAGIYDRTHGKYVVKNENVILYHVWKDGKDEEGQWYFGSAKAPDGTDLGIGIAIKPHIPKNGFYYKQLGYGTYSATYYENDKPQVTYTITSFGYDSRRIFKFRPPGGYGYDPAPIALYQIAIVDKYYCNVINEGEELSYDEILERARKKHCKVLPSEFSCSFKGAIAFCYPFNDRMARVAAENALYGQY